MHEISVLYEVVKYAEKQAIANNLNKIDEIVLEVGELSGILPIFLEKYYSVVVIDSSCLRDSKLTLQITPGEAICNECEVLYNVQKNDGLCPNCESTNKTILGGKDFIISKLIAYS
ncbi:hydrogenase maturation nickel metallochaperone HypA [Acetobacterium wieringae]|uniref:Hydrogenase maturation nickel metallochaperone HypA n=1 Tax=Acetobacterium wieringae TaxID=52694 RepID=A0ABY6HHF5_9FIRM|nr:hydrogenase maturation nickel metallochaperone HypA [Acetobacterium wieringae]MEA4807281.1 hydrogenase maturation nickel metallochaperone HypA [Acetobacterium wieringae]UYO63967.1 hydrogenase maturation nickel metallochaperone HypA [Acetobacterium wieringae]